MFKTMAFEIRMNIAKEATVDGCFDNASVKHEPKFLKKRKRQF